MNMQKPDYEHEKSKAKRAADLIEFAEEVLAILKESGEEASDWGTVADIARDHKLLP